jgi:hypothetical protein
LKEGFLVKNKMNSEQDLAENKKIIDDKLSKENMVLIINTGINTYKYGKQNG